MPPDTTSEPLLNGKTPPHNVRVKQHRCGEFQQRAGHLPD
jgi:hypothetical protein